MALDGARSGAVEHALQCNPPQRAAAKLICPSTTSRDVRGVPISYRSCHRLSEVAQTILACRKQTHLCFEASAKHIPVSVSAAGTACGQRAARALAILRDDERDASNAAGCHAFVCTKRVGTFRNLAGSVWEAALTRSDKFHASESRANICAKSRCKRLIELLLSLRVSLRSP